MLKGCVNKRLGIFVGVFFIFSSILIVFMMYTVSNSYAQDKTAIEADKIKNLLLGQKEWIMEWNVYGGNTGMTDIVLEDRGKKIIAHLNVPDDRTKCKRKIKITSDGFMMDGCRMGTIHFIFDPNDNRYPFKGESQKGTAKFKVK